MIIKEVTIKVYRNEIEYFDEQRDNWCLKFGDLQFKEDKIDWSEEVREGKLTFNLFTDKGKVSKQDKNYHNLTAIPDLKNEVESKLQSILKIEAETQKDMDRALELKAIIDSADFDGELVSIKHKVSKSKWYDHEGIGNMRSRYDVCVPAIVENEALELQAIRKKHQDNDNFDFYATSYKTIEVREADHAKF